MNLRSPSAICLGLLLTLAASFAEGDIRRLFEERRSQQQERRAMQKLAMAQLHVMRLQALEATLAESADYEKAKQCQVAWKKVKAILPAGVALELRFGANEAKLRGGVSMQNGAVVGWRANAEASWKLPELLPGGYEVWIEHNSVKAPVSIRVSEAEFHVTGLLKSEGTKTSLGYLKVTQASGNIKLTTDNAEMPLKIRSLILIAQAPVK